MAKAGATGVRFDTKEREALSQAAERDQRSVSSLVRKIVVEWLRENGYLKSND
jgi:hypothetical protein